MRYLLTALVMIFTVSVCARAQDAIRGDYVGDWSGASGAGGSFRLSIVAENSAPKCTVTFSYAGEEVKTHVTACKIDGPALEAQYDFDLGGNRLQSTIHGQLKQNALTGKYETKALADGSAVDQGDWKAIPAPKAP
jgi:hypothetical protein